MGGAPTVSVCVPTHRSADTLARALRSALEQIDDVLEVLVVDDASDDATLGVVTTFAHPALRAVVNPSRLGLAGNHDRCLQLARGDVVQFLHADDELLPGAVAGARAAFADPHVVLVAGPREVVTDDEAWRRGHADPHGPLQLCPGRNDGDRLVLAHLRTGRLDNLLGEPSSVAVRREAALAVGGFRAVMTQWVDVDLWLRLLARGDAVWLSQPRAVRHHHARNASNALRSRPRERWAPALLGWGLLTERGASWPVRRSAAAFTVRAVAQLASGVVRQVGRQVVHRLTPSR